MIIKYGRYHGWTVSRIQWKTFDRQSQWFSSDNDHKSAFWLFIQRINVLKTKQSNILIMSYSKTLYKITNSNTPSLNLLKGCIQIFFILKKLSINSLFSVHLLPLPQLLLLKEENILQVKMSNIFKIFCNFIDVIQISRYDNLSPGDDELMGELTLDELKMAFR